MNKAIPMGALAGLAVTLLADPSQAAAYCSDGPSHPDGLEVADISFGIPASAAAPADDCFGRYEWSGREQLADIQSIWRDPNFIFLDKFEIDEQSSTGEVEGSLNGIEFQLSLSGRETAPDGQENWSFDLSWSPIPTQAFFMDLVFTQKGASGDNSAASYFFDNVLIPATDASGGGAVKVVVQTPGNGNSLPDWAGLSHLSAFGSFERVQIPLPASLAFFVLGLAGFAFARLSRRKV